jgi:K+/H+ antiporter YhaU regulatory subunit KhtT
VVGIERDGSFLPNPGPGFRLAPGDLIATMGSPEQHGAFEQLANPEGGRRNGSCHLDQDEKLLFTVEG